MAFSRLTCQYACVRERGGGTPVVAWHYDVVFASDARGGSKLMDLSCQTSECEAFRAPPISQRPPKSLLGLCDDDPRL